jgi:hypothetical protein
MTMGFDDDGDGDPTAGQTEEAVDTAEDGMELEETTEAVVGHMETNSMSSSLQKKGRKQQEETRQRRQGWRRSMKKRMRKKKNY